MKRDINLIVGSYFIMRLLPALFCDPEVTDKGGIKYEQEQPVI